MKKYIAYYRVSTKQQGQSGLGLGAQKDAVERFIKYEEDRTGQRSSLYAEFQEIESGTNNDRSKIKEAINLCRRLSSCGGNDEFILLIAKLDRLSRSIEFINTLQNSDIKFVCCDMPDANNLTINMMAVIAQNEAEMIAVRTRDALAIKVKNNPNGWIDRHGQLRTRLGNPINFSHEARMKGGESRKKMSQENPNNIRATNYSDMLRGLGYSLKQIADKLNQDGFRTSEGSFFLPTQIKRLLDRKNKLNIKN